MSDEGRVSGGVEARPEPWVVAEEPDWTATATGLNRNRVDLSAYRASPTEQMRIGDLLGHTPSSGGVALDVGARDGYLSVLLAERFERVIALDLVLPEASVPRVTWVQADAVQLPFPDGAIDFVLCAEVLEHLPTSILPRVCAELERVCSGDILVGVPYREDNRVGRTTCRSCGGTNPPWGHVNSFDESRLQRLFARCEVKATSFVGESRQRTNAISVALLDLAGNPFGTYAQEEPCIHCGRALTGPPPRTAATPVPSTAAA